jgi:hypothetical protein
MLSSGYAAQLNWFDDERWRIVVDNFGVVAQIAAWLTHSGRSPNWRC